MADDALAPSQLAFNDKVAVDVTNAIPGEGIADGAVTPGAVVITGTANLDLKESGADAKNALGWAGENISTADPVSGTAKKLTDDFADGERFPYWTGGTWWGILKDGESIVRGDRLKPAANGELAKLADADNPALAVAVYEGEADAAPSGSNQRILTRWIA